MYAHQRCCPSDAELDFKKKVHGYCGICGNQGTIYLIVGTEDSYKQRRQGVTEWINTTDTLSYDEIIVPSKEALEGDLTEEIEAIREVAKEAETVVIDAVLVSKRRPDKTELEVKPEHIVHDENGSLVALTDDGGHVSLEAKSEVKESLQEESPEETAPAEAVEPTEEEVVAPSPEEEAEVVKDTIAALESLAGTITDEEAEEVFEKVDKNAEIARLEAELAKLTSNQKQ